LATIRHRNSSAIFLTQHTGLADKNIKRLRDILWWKRSNSYELIEDESNRGNRNHWSGVRQKMVPREKNENLFEYPAKREFIKFTHELPDCWSEGLSKSWKELSFGNDDKKEDKAVVTKRSLLLQQLKKLKNY
jgi:hypothetical protein